MGDSETFTLPSWVTDLRVLAPVAGTLAAFARDPEGFILNRVLTFFVARVIDGGAFVVGVVADVWGLLAEIPSTVFSPIFEAGSLVTSAVAGVILLVNDAVVSVAMLSGPAAPLLVVIVWMMIGLAVTWTINALLTVVKWI